MRRRLLRSAPLVLTVAALLITSQDAGAISSAGVRAQARVAGLQVALGAAGHYRGPVDGIAGPLTMRALRSFQRAHGLPVSGDAGPATLRLLGPLGRPAPGSRLLRKAMIGLDVAALQFELSRQRYRVVENGSFDAATWRALIRFQQ